MTINRSTLRLLPDAPFSSNHLVNGKENEATTGALIRAALCGHYSTGDFAADALRQIAGDILILELAARADTACTDGRIDPEVMRGAFDALSQRARAAAE